MSSDKLNTKESSDRLEDIAKEILNLQLMFWILRHRNKVDDPFDLTESEYAVLAHLAKTEVCTIGELQKLLAVRPAQMSRIIRSLENKEKSSLIKCEINPTDKRKVNVQATDSGKKAYTECMKLRLAANLKLLEHLEESEQKELKKVLSAYRRIMSAEMSGD